MLKEKIMKTINTYILNSRLIDRVRKLPNFLLLLSFVEMWERFSYYGMRALLVIFLVKEFHFDDPKAYAIYSVFAAISYAGPVLGGILADKLMGFRKMVVMGAIVTFMGHMLMASGPLEDSLFYMGLGAVALGAGLFKGNIANLLGEFYKKEDPCRDHGFTIFYVGVNLGGFLGTIFCGYVAHLFGWHYGFGLAGIGMLLGLLVLYRFAAILESKGLCPNPKLLQKRFSPLKLNLETILWGGAVLGCLLSSLILVYSERTTLFFGILGVVVIAYLVREFKKADRSDRKNIIKLAIYMIFFMSFFALEMQLGSLGVLFAERNVNNNVLGILIPSTVSQSINPLIIFTFGGMVSEFWARRGGNKCALRFGSGLGLMAISFLVFYIGCQLANAQGLVNFSYLFLGQMVMSIGELCLAPLVLSLTSELAPRGMKGAMMGIIMLSLSFSNLAGILIGKFMAVPTLPSGECNALVSLEIYGEGFLKIMIFNVLITLIFIGISLVFSLERRVKESRVLEKVV